MKIGNVELEPLRIEVSASGFEARALFLELILDMSRDPIKDLIRPFNEEYLAEDFKSAEGRQIALTLIAVGCVRPNVLDDTLTRIAVDRKAGNTPVVELSRFLLGSNCGLPGYARQDTTRDEKSTGALPAMDEIFSDWKTFRNLEGTHAAREVIEEWSRKWNLTAEWCLDFALDVLRSFLVSFHCYADFRAGLDDSSEFWMYEYKLEDWAWKSWHTAVHKLRRSRFLQLLAALSEIPENDIFEYTFAVKQPHQALPALSGYRLHGRFTDKASGEFEVEGQYIRTTVSRPDGAPFEFKLTGRIIQQMSERYRVEAHVIAQSTAETIGTVVNLAGDLTQVSTTASSPRESSAEFSITGNLALDQVDTDHETQLQFKVEFHFTPNSASRENREAPTEYKVEGRFIPKTSSEFTIEDLFTPYSTTVEEFIDRVTLKFWDNLFKTYNVHRSQWPRRTSDIGLEIKRFVESLNEYIRRCVGKQASHGRAVVNKPSGKRHFGWAVKYQVLGFSHSEIAREEDVSPASVRQGIGEICRVLGLSIREGKRTGRPRGVKEYKKRHVVRD